jgi:hypothetical protein
MTNPRHQGVNAYGLLLTLSRSTGEGGVGLYDGIEIAGKKYCTTRPIR